MSTVEKITKQNINIAEFMAEGEVETHHNSYHTNWNELMAVIEKIHRTKEASIEIHSNSTKISHKGKTKIFAGGLGDSLDNTYRAVLEYINDN